MRISDLTQKMLVILIQISPESTIFGGTLLSECCDLWSNYSSHFPGPLHGRLPPPVVLSSVNGRLFWEPGPNKNTAAREAAKVAVFFLCLAHLGPSQMVRITVTPGGESMKSKSPWTELVETLRRFFFNVFFATQMSQARLNCPACSIMFLDTDHTPHLTSWRFAKMLYSFKRH